MRKRRVWTGLILGLLAACLLSGTAMAASKNTGTLGTLTWTLSGTTLTVSGTGAIPACPGPDTTPAEGSETAAWFQARSNAVTVELTSGITTVGEYAFAGCTRLKNLTLPQSLTAVNTSAFEGCTGLGSVKFSHGLTSIGISAFSGCSSLTSVLIPSSTTSIGANAFQSCGLTSLLLPSSVRTIGAGAFNNCQNLPAVHYGGPFSNWHENPEGGPGNKEIPIHYYLDITMNQAFQTCNEHLDSYYGLFGRCKDCSYSFEQRETMPRLEHVEQTLTKKEPTCVEAGYEAGSRCQRCETGECDKVFSGLVPIAPLGHEIVSEEEVTKQETCTTDGEKIVHETCTRCDYKRDLPPEIIPAAHIPVEEYPAIEVTCEQDGQTQGTRCLRCNKRITNSEIIPAPGHQFTRTKIEDMSQPATCELAGQDCFELYCEVCGETRPDYVDVEALGHLPPTDPGKIVEIIFKVPTCAPGIKKLSYVCTREGCGVQVEGDPIPIPAEDEHTWITDPMYPAKAPTCMEGGRTEQIICSVCGEVKQEWANLPVDRDAHAPGDPDDPDNPNNDIGGLKVEEKQSTCTEPGKKTTIILCALCHKELSRTTEETDPAKGHQSSGAPVKEETTEPTCTEPGKKISTYICDIDICGEEFTKEETVGEAAGHKFGEWTVVLEPTATTPGMRGRECSVCHIQETEEIPATGKFTVTFDPNGGVLPEGTPATAVTGADGKLPGPLPTPTRAGGYTFEGWFTAAIDGNPVGDEPVFTGDITLYAHWSGGTETFTITFDPGEGTLAAESDKTAVTKPGGVLEALPGNPTRDGYAFDGWYTEKEGGSKISAGHVFSANATLYAHWTEKTSPDPSEGFTVTFDPNGGALAAESDKTAQTGKDGKLSALPAAPTRSGYTFDGWYTAASGGSAVTTSTVFDQDTTVYAHWRSGSSGDTYLIRVDDTDFGSLTASASKAAEGEKITIYANPDSGYRLSSLRVTDGSGTKLTLTRETDTRYTFVMPASLVNVTGSFIRDSSSGNVNDPSGGSWNTGAAWNPTDTVTVPEPVPVVQSVPQITAYGQAFQDVPQGYWAAGEIAWASQHGYMNGVGNGSFAPERLISHQQLWTVLVRLLSYSNVSDSNLQAVRAGLLDGGNPGAATTRQEMVTALYRCAFLLGGARSPSVSINTYPDASQVSGYARDAMAWAVTNGILTGNAQGRLNPNGTVSRAQFAVILYRFSQRYGR